MASTYSPELHSLAKLGDSILNCVVSAALSLISGKPVGVKVSDKTLRREIAKLRISLKPRVPREDLAEALVAYIWLNGVRIDELIEKTVSMSEKADIGEVTRCLLRYCLEQAVKTKQGKEFLNHYMEF